MNSEIKETFLNAVYCISIAAISIVLFIGVIFGAMAAYSKYNVWSSSLAGKAELSQANWNRQIAVKEA